jgi:hypothetical protein
MALRKGTTLQLAEKLPVAKTPAALYQGTTLVVPQTPQKSLGFSP